MVDSALEFNLSKYDKLSIGRSEKCDIRLNGESVSRLHAVIMCNKGRYVISDQKSSNGTFLNGQKLSESHTLKNGDKISISGYELSYSEGIISITNGKSKVSQDSKKDNVKASWGESGYIHDYRRTPRLEKKLPLDVVEIDAPPSQVNTPEASWFQMLASPVTTIIIMVMMTLLSIAAPSMMLFSIPMSMVSIILSVSNYLSNKKKANKNSTLREKKYLEYLEEKETLIRRLKKKQIDALQQNSPSLQECIKIVIEKDTRLWAKRPLDSDFLSVRIGCGECTASFSVKGLREGFTMEEDPLLEAAKDLVKKSSKVQGAPIECDLLNDRLIGVIGNRQAVINLGKNMVVEMTTMHSYEDIRLITLAKQSEKEIWDFIKWLPHSFDEDNNHRYYASNVSDIETMLKGVEESLKQRDLKINETRKIAFQPYYVFIITDVTQLNILPTIWKYIFQKDNLGVSAILLFDDMDKLPKECNVIIDVEETQGVIYSKANTDKKTKFLLEHVRVDLNEYDTFARSMAPIRSVGGVSETSLPKMISFFEGYEIDLAEDVHLLDRWANARPQNTMAVPIGVRANGDTFYFNIFETAHGPHGLVAGTTGAGKTEIIQTWILSMALNFSPQDVSFVLMDFKGTNLILPFENLPHVAGTISDIDSNIERNIQALESEIVRRERLFHENSVTNIKDYLDKRNESIENSMEAISFLFIVVDEFAELKSQFPEFMAWIESTFAKGRSLGIYIILMTQKPDGVVSEKMDANAKFRICLRTQTTGDSKAMIKREDAAFIKNPGRAYIKVGEDEVYELIQSYYCNAPIKQVGDAKKQYSVSLIDDIGRRIRVNEKINQSLNKKNIVEERAVLVDYISKLAKESQFAKARKVWTPQLSNAIALDSISMNNYQNGAWLTNYDDCNVTIGVLDDPSNQSQYPLNIDFVHDGHVVVYGSPQSGKTTLIQTMLLAAVKKYSPENINIYVLDFGSHVLDGLFRDYPHVGAVANDIEEAKLFKIIEVLKDIFSNRKNEFAKEGVSNLETYCKVSGKKVPYILVAVDRYEALRETYDEIDEFLTILSREAGSYGIYLFITTGNLNGISYKMAQNIKVTMALRLADRSDYASVVGRTNIIPEDSPGRGLIKMTTPLEFQVALPAVFSSEAETILFIKKLGKEMSQTWKGRAATPVRSMPNEIPYGSIKASTAGNVVLGLNTESIMPEEVSLADVRLITVEGDLAKTKNVAELIIREQLIDGTKVDIVDFDANNIIFSDNRNVIPNMSSFDIYLDEIIQELNIRKNNYDANLELPEMKKIVLWISDYKTVFEQASEKIVKRIGAIARLGEGLNVFLGTTIGKEDYEYFVSRGEEVCYSTENEGCLISVNDDSCFLNCGEVKHSFKLMSI